MTNRFKRVIGLSILVSSFVFAGLAWSASTDLYYNFTHNRLQGTSTHTLETTPGYYCASDGWVEVPFMYDTTDGNQDGQMFLCTSFQATRVAAGIQTYLTSPSQSRNEYLDSFPTPDLDNDYPTATVNYDLGNPVSGYFVADADHYSTTHIYSCAAYHAWQGLPTGVVAMADYESCQLASASADNYIENTSDGAEVP